MSLPPAGSFFKDGLFSLDVIVPRIIFGGETTEEWKHALPVLRPFAEGFRPTNEPRGGLIRPLQKRLSPNNRATRWWRIKHRLSSTQFVHSAATFIGLLGKPWNPPSHCHEEKGFGHRLRDFPSIHSPIRR